MKKTFISLILVLILCSSAHCEDFSELLQFPKIGVTNDFLNKNQLYLDFGMEYQDQSFSGRYWNVKCKYLYLSIPIERFTIPFLKVINYSLLEFYGQGNFNEGSFETNKTSFFDFSFRIINRDKNYSTGVNEINYFLLNNHFDYPIVANKDFNFITYGFGFQIGASQFEVDNIDPNIRKSFPGFDWSLNANFVARNDFGGFEVLTMLRNIGSLWIYSFQTSIGYSFKKKYLEHGIDYGIDHLYDILNLGLSFNRTRYRYNHNERYINSLKLNLDLNLHHLLFPNRDY